MRSKSDIPTERLVRSSADDARAWAASREGQAEIARIEAMGDDSDGTGTIVRGLIIFLVIAVPGALLALPGFRLAREVPLEVWLVESDVLYADG